MTIKQIHVAGSCSVKKSILQVADGLVNGPRQKAYGNPYEHFKKVAVIASALTGKDFTALDCVRVLKATKLARETNKHKRDNLIDETGYVWVENEVIEKMKRRGEM